MTIEREREREEGREGGREGGGRERERTVQAGVASSQSTHDTYRSLLHSTGAYKTC